MFQRNCYFYALVSDPYLVSAATQVWILESVSGRKKSYWNNSKNRANIFNFCRFLPKDPAKYQTLDLQHTGSLKRWNNYKAADRQTDIAIPAAMLLVCTNNLNNALLFKFPKIWLIHFLLSNGNFAALRTADLKHKLMESLKISSTLYCIFL